MTFINAFDTGATVYFRFLVVYELGPRYDRRIPSVIWAVLLEIKDTYVYTSWSQISISYLLPKLLGLLGDLFILHCL